MNSIEERKQGVWRLKCQGDGQEIETQSTLPCVCLFSKYFEYFPCPGIPLKARGCSTRLHMIFFSCLLYSVQMPTSSSLQPRPSFQERDRLSNELFLGTLSHQGLQWFCRVRFRLFNCSSISWAPKSKLSSLSAFKVRDTLQNTTGQCSR